MSALQPAKKKGNEIARPPRRIDVTKYIAEAERAIEAATAPGDAFGIEKRLHTLETAMADSGLYSPDEMRAVNELRMKARWHLGVLLRNIERHQGKRTLSPGATKLTDELKRLGLDRQVALEAQRIACMPKAELEKELARNHRQGVLTSFAGLIRTGRHFWQKANREHRHQVIALKAERAQAAMPDTIGPYALLYPDPPYHHDTYGDAGGGKGPIQHYPTMRVDEIANYTIRGKRVSDIAARAAVLFLWRTSSCPPRDQDQILTQWGFTFKSEAIWDKRPGMGTGHDFRNQHEVLMYATRGDMPAPQVIYPSIFSYPATEHSRKPPEVRAAIEAMYPNFDERHRAELFARTDETIPGWTLFGFEAAVPEEDVA
jgi:N6-adenosine-specific RNA methylase IME4